MHFSNITERGENNAPTVVVHSDLLNEDEREYFEERAAIMEFDGGLERRQAEQEAWRLVLKRRIAYNLAG